MNINTKFGTAIDFIIYVVASRYPISDNSIHGFFYQYYNQIISNSDYLAINSEKIRQNINEVYETETENFKSELLEHLIENVFSYYASEVTYLRKDNLDEQIVKENYFDYINMFVDTADFTVSNEEFSIYKIDSLEDLFNASEIKLLIRYISYYLTQEETYNEQENIWELVAYKDNVVDLIDLKDYFEQYISLRKELPIIFIGYYASMVKFFISNVEMKMKRFVREINGLFSSPLLNDISNSVKYCESLIEKNEKMFYQYSFDIPQLDGFFDKSYIPKISIYDTLWNYFNIINTSEILNYHFLSEINPYVYKDLDANHSMYAVKLKYLKFKLYGEKENLTVDLRSQLNKLLHEQHAFVSFLKIRNFNIDQIEIVFNTLAENKYGRIGIKYFNLDRDIYFFRFCYFFYVFDYFTEIKHHQFNTILSFDCITRFDTDNRRENKQQYLKNHSNIGNSEHKDYPFALKMTENFLAEVEYSVGIDREKLKHIPE